MAIKRRKSDLIWSYTAYVLTLGINIFLLPIVLKVLTSDELGLWYTFSSVYAVVSIVDFGFSPTIIRNLTYAFNGAKVLKKDGLESEECMGKPNILLFTNVFMCSKYLCMAVSFLAFILLISVGSVYIKYISRDMGNIYMLAWLVYAIGSFMNLYFNYWTNSLKSIGAIAESQKAIVFAKLAHLAVSVIGIAVGSGIFALAVAYVVSGFAQRALSRNAFIKKGDIYNQILENKKILKKDEIKKMFQIIWFNAKKAGVSTLASSAMSQSGTIICSGILGVGVTGAYGLAHQLVAITCSVGQIYFQTSIPLLTGARVTNNKKQEMVVFSSSVVVFWIIVLFGILAICTLGLPLLGLLGANTIPSLWLILGVALFYVPESNYSIHATYISMGNKLPFVRSLVFACVIRIVLCFLLAKYSQLGIMSIIVASVVSNFMFIVWKWPKEALKELDITARQLIISGITALISNLRGLIPKQKKK